MESKNQNHLSASMSKEILFRMTRLETKLVRGFSEIGIDLSNDDWIELNDEEKILNLKTLGRSMKVILTKMHELGASKFDHEYEMYYKNKLIGTIIFDLDNFE